MPKNIEVPPALVAQVDQLQAMNQDLLNTFIGLATEGFENNYNALTITSTVGYNIEHVLDLAEFTRSQLMVLLTVAVVEMARAQHEGDWG